MIHLIFLPKFPLLCNDKHKITLTLNINKTNNQTIQYCKFLHANRQQTVVKNDRWTPYRVTHRHTKIWRGRHTSITYERCELQSPTLSGTDGHRTRSPQENIRTHSHPFLVRLTVIIFFTCVCFVFCFFGWVIRFGSVSFFRKRIMKDTHSHP